MIRYLRGTNPSLLRGVALLRLDFNTEDDWRMRTEFPTIKLLLNVASKVVIISHHGRPKGVEKALSLKKKAKMLAKLMRQKVIVIPGSDFRKIKKIIEKSPMGSLFLLENLRFNAGEEKNDRAFAKKLASLADFYVNDAFAVSHRADASVAAITRFLPSYAGLELEREIDFLSRVMKKPKRPLVFVVGGAKAADKLDAIHYFYKKADWFLLGGGLANTILTLRGVDIKASVRDTDKKDVRELAYFSRASRVLSPTDFVWHGKAIWDIGPKTAAAYAKKIASAKTILWSGPLGLIEKPRYAHGSVAIAKAIAKNRRALSVTGGGETVMFLKKYRLDKAFSFISTGGGAMIDFLAGKKLPGIEALK